MDAHTISDQNQPPSADAPKKMTAIIKPMRTLDRLDLGGLDGGGMVAWFGG
jgi:hypothetical protein